MGRLVRVLLAAAGAAAIAGAPAASGAPQPWEPSLSVPDDPASIQALSLARPGVLLAVGGHNVPGAYDQPTVWRYRKGIWHTERIPVDLTNSWGYATAVGQASGDEWVGGWTTNQSTGGETPFVAHRQGGHWGVLTHQWLDPADSQGGVAAIVMRGPQDVWVVVNEGPIFEGLTESAIWHFDGRFWQHEPAMPLHNGQCFASSGFTTTSAALTTTDLLVSANCTTLGYKSAGVVERFDGRHWHKVLALPAGTSIQDIAVDPAGTIWAAGSMADFSGLARGAAWTGNAAGMTPVSIPTPSQSILYSVAASGKRVEFAGEDAGGFGPGPLLVSSASQGRWRLEGIPYDRGLSSVVIGSHGQLWVSGPVFGGWIGGDPPHAEVLTRLG